MRIEWFKRLLRLWFACTVGFSLAWSQASAQTSAQRLPRQLLPYIQPQEVPMTNGGSPTKVIWLSNERIAFTARKRGVTSARWEKVGDLTITTPEITDDVIIFDTATEKSTKHTDGWLLRYEDGRMTISLKEVRTNKFLQMLDRKDSYDIRLDGPLGQEKRVTYSLTNDPSRLLKCPTDPGPENTGSNLILRAGQGCLYHPGTWSTRNEKWTYFRIDGSRATLEAARSDVGFSQWIEWLGAHMLNTYTSKGVVQPGPDPRLFLFWPDGVAKELPKNDAYFAIFSVAQNIRPTRAGLVLNSPGRDPPRSDDGVFIWRNNEALQIAEGLISVIEVSPDGCRVAFLVRPSSLNELGERLRIVNLCKVFGVLPDANPYR